MKLIIKSKTFIFSLIIKFLLLKLFSLKSGSNTIFLIEFNSISGFFVFTPTVRLYLNSSSFKTPILPTNH